MMTHYVLVIRKDCCPQENRKRLFATLNESRGVEKTVTLRKFNDPIIEY